MDGYLDFLFLGTIGVCAGGNIAHFGNGRLLRAPSGRALWGVAALGLLAIPIFHLIHDFTWEVIAASILGAVIGALVGRLFRRTNFEFIASLSLIVLGVTLLVQSLNENAII